MAELFYLFFSFSFSLYFFLHCFPDYDLLLWIKDVSEESLTPNTRNSLKEVFSKKCIKWIPFLLYTGMSLPPSEGRTMRDVLQAINGLVNARHGNVKHMLNTKSLLDMLGYTPKLSGLRLVHVAGTKGKGTTSWYTSNFLECYGVRVGLFTSPHLTDVRERFLVNNKKLEEKKFVNYFFTVFDAIGELRGSPIESVRQKAESVGLFSFFFLLCVYIFDQEQVEVAVIETGIGGRFDSTNMIQPVVSVITALGYDHMPMLGNTIELIADQKAGIIKPGATCYSFSQRDYPQTRHILSEEAAKCRTPIVFFEEDTFPVPTPWPALAMGGTHMVENSKVGLLVARQVSGRQTDAPLSDEEKRVLEESKLAGRSQVLKVKGSPLTLFLDGAHTPESIRYAAKWFAEESEKRAGMGCDHVQRVLLFYCSRDPELVLRSFEPHAALFQKAVIAQIYNPKPSALSPPYDDVEGWRKYARQQMEETKAVWDRLFPTVPCEGMTRRLVAWEDVHPYLSRPAKEGSEVHVFVCGSFFLLADLLHGIENEKLLETTC